MEPVPVIPRGSSDAAHVTQKPQGSVGRGAQDGHLSHYTAPELWDSWLGVKLFKQTSPSLETTVGLSRVSWLVSGTGKNKKERKKSERENLHAADSVAAPAAPLTTGTDMALRKPCQCQSVTSPRDTECAESAACLVPPSGTQSKDVQINGLVQFVNGRRY